MLTTGVLIRDTCNQSPTPSKPGTTLPEWARGSQDLSLTHGIYLSQSSRIAAGLKIQRWEHLCFLYTYVACGGQSRKARQ